MEKTNGGTKHDAGKRQWHLLPFDALEEVIKVLEFGATKYDKYNWTKGFAFTRLLDAAFRHIKAFIGGEDNDPETGCSHIAHAICCLLFLLTFIKKGGGSDDRYVGTKFRPATDTIHDQPHDPVKTKNATKFANAFVRISPTQVKTTFLGNSPIIKGSDHD